MDAQAKNILLAERERLGVEQERLSSERNRLDERLTKIEETIDAIDRVVGGRGRGVHRPQYPSPVGVESLPVHSVIMNALMLTREPTKIAKIMEIARDWGRDEIKINTVRNALTRLVQDTKIERAGVGLYVFSSTDGERDSY